MDKIKPENIITKKKELEIGDRVEYRV